MELNKYYNYLIDNGIASEETMQIITSINGYSKETLDSVLYCTTGYRNIDQYLGLDEDEEEEDEEE